MTCKEYANSFKKELRSEIKRFSESPKLTVIQIRNDPASDRYIRGKMKDCKEVGIEFEHMHLEDVITTNEVIEIIQSYDSDGIIVQGNLCG